MTGPTRMSEAPTLVEEYEALRKEVIDLDGHSHRVRGLALLVRKGMAAWMKRLSEHPTGLATSVSRSCPLPASPGIEQHVVDILATMALAATGRGFCDLREPLKSASSAPQKKRLSVRAPIDVAAGV